MSPQDRPARSLRWAATARRRRADRGMGVHPASTGAFHPGAPDAATSASQPTGKLLAFPVASTVVWRGDVDGMVWTTLIPTARGASEARSRPCVQVTTWTISSCVRGKTAIVAVKGEFDRAGALAWSTRWRGWCLTRPRHLTVDLGDPGSWM